MSPGPLLHDIMHGTVACHAVRLHAQKSPCRIVSAAWVQAGWLVQDKSEELLLDSIMPSSVTLEEALWNHMHYQASL